MVKNRIRVYARLKKETKICKPINYSVANVDDGDLLTVYQDHPKSNRYKFRFDKVFDTTSTQNELFDSIAKPIINGVLNGFNGTIFAYGPTGSGKTYSLTGSHTKYNNRGLIPRSIEYIFNFITKSFDDYVINISYLEIYNEIAYDLLNSKENVSTLEELPRVLLLEDNKGEAHYKNLSVPRVCTEEEAMRLLFLGDTNRTIAETPLNEYSSRSHCIFTVHVTTRVQDTGKIIKSKLNLVDLAGSERVHKMNLNGITLSEAKYINLSLHYLEQVILAIAETKRVHIPFRNSMMTFVLRDSISGNCLTAMLATVAIAKFNLEETITTCKFAQRVSLVKTDVKINEESDPQAEITLLRSEIVKLRKVLMNKNGDNITSQDQLDELEEAQCQNSIKNYLYNNQEEELSLNDSRKVKYYIEFLKKEIRRQNKEKIDIPVSTSEIEFKYKQIIKQKDEEISILMNIFNNKLEEEKLRLPKASEVFGYEITTTDKTDFNTFIAKPEYKNTLAFYANTIEEKHHKASNIARALSEEQNKITNIRNDIDTNCNNFERLEQLSFQLKSEQNIYRELLLKLQNIKSEIEYLKNGSRQFQTKVMDDFKKWLLTKKVSEKTETTTYRPRKCTSRKISSDFSIPHYTHSQLDIRKCRSERFDIHAELDLLFDMKCNENEKIEPSQMQLPERDTNYCDTSQVQTVYIKEIHDQATSSSSISQSVIEEEHPVREECSSNKSLNAHNDLFKYDDTKEFLDFMSTIPLTGDRDVDEEIVKFYRIKFKC